MPISKESLEEFREIYQKEFGRRISEEDSLEMATRLIKLYMIIYRPLSGEDSTPPSGDHPASDASFPTAE
ncbi:MAG: hypothetical protein JWN18_568 [Parcubacteria group bacterium]|nr:hypothetical protein [Parcubacteria group bacterium]